MTTAIDQVWREQPSGSMFEMTQGDWSEPSIFPATPSYNADKARMASVLECDYIKVRMETYWMRWLPEEAEAQWRSDHCECEDGPHYPGVTISTDTGKEFPPDECATTEPAKEVWDFWDESGTYCPWMRCKRTDPGAVKFRRGELPRA